MSTIKFEIENKDHDTTILIGKHAIFRFNPNTKNGEELSDFISGCEEVPDNEADLRKENEEMKAMLNEVYLHIKPLTRYLDEPYKSGLESRSRGIEELLNKHK